MISIVPFIASKGVITYSFLRRYIPPFSPKIPTTKNNNNDDGMMDDTKYSG
jgi:hypothetical protein